jgi:hypothetical protein
VARRRREREALRRALLVASARLRRLLRDDGSQHREDEFNGDPAFLIGEATDTLGSVGDYTGDGKPDPGSARRVRQRRTPSTAVPPALRQAVEDLTHGGEYDDDSPLTYDQEIAEVAGAEYTDGTRSSTGSRAILWRPVDHTYVGLDGWAEVHSSWVIIDKGSDLSRAGTHRVRSRSSSTARSRAPRSSSTARSTPTRSRGPLGLRRSPGELRDESGQLFCDGLQPE